MRTLKENFIFSYVYLKKNPCFFTGYRTFSAGSLFVVTQKGIIVKTLYFY